MKLLVLFSAILASASSAAASPSGYEVDPLARKLDAPPGTAGSDGYEQPGSHGGTCICNDGKLASCDACCEVLGGISSCSIGPCRTC
ncbi:hypothetical protein F5884DRAFT_790494 [Xylogone sp. PMI_703]|nr:hypothetical protein F5884DRAFT_790494 [Xylogone sp. PMI_703]